jgi:hypothetical protein
VGRRMGWYRVCGFVDLDGRLVGWYSSPLDGLVDEFSVKGFAFSRIGICMCRWDGNGRLLDSLVLYSSGTLSVV